jgi:hypothetical protein
MVETVETVVTVCVHHSVTGLELFVAEDTRGVGP